MKPVVALLLLLTLYTGCGGQLDPQSSPPPPSAMPASVARGIDYSWARPGGAAIKGAGFQFACRYLAPPSGKVIGAAEVADLHASGLGIVLVWEDSATNALGGTSQGVADARAALGQANALGFPAALPIYFAVDFDATPAQQAPIDAYLRGAASVLGAGRVGVYGGFYVVQRCFQNHTAAYGWQTLAWSGGQVLSGAHLYQNGQQAFGSGADVDEALQPSYGAWFPTPPDQPPRGWLDAVSCQGAAGWAQDPDIAQQPIDVHFYYNAGAGQPGAVGPTVIAADGYRADLCTAIGSCNHGYSAALPRSLQDGQPHAVHVYGINNNPQGVNAELSGSPKDLQCPAPAIPAGVRRWVTSGQSFAAWAFDAFWDVAHYPQGPVEALRPGPDLPAAPQVVQADDGTPEVWVLDGVVRRHVRDPASLSAWRFGAVAKMAAARVYGYVKGPDWRETPVLVQGAGPEVYVIDDDPTIASPDLGGTADAGVNGSGDGGPDGAALSSGCSMAPLGRAGRAPAGGGVVGLLLLLLIRPRATRQQRLGLAGRGV